MTIKEIMARAFKTNEEHGWHEPSTTVGDRLMLIVTEIAEAMEDYRERANWHEIKYEPACHNCKPDGLPAELADAVIRIADFAAIYNIDLERAIQEKMDYNETRPWRHGNKRV